MWSACVHMYVCMHAARRGVAFSLGRRTGAACACWRTRVREGGGWCVWGGAGGANWHTVYSFSRKCTRKLVTVLRCV